MVRRGKIPSSPSKLSQILANLHAQPKLTLSGLKSLKLSLAYRNDHFGARHFVKEQLPRIRYANPTLDVKVEKVKKTAQEMWRPEMELHFANGVQKSIDMHEKLSTSILKELMDKAGGSQWQNYVTTKLSAGLPLFPGVEVTVRPKVPSLTPLPTLHEFRTALEGTKAGGKQKTGQVPSPRPKTGAAAVLP